jgi:hypothetical protein
MVGVGAGCGTSAQAWLSACNPLSRVKLLPASLERPWPTQPMYTMSLAPSPGEAGSTVMWKL